MPKVCLYFSISSIKTATQKFISFDKFFKCTLIGQLLQYNVTKLFQIKLKTTEHYQSHLMDKNQMNFSANPILGLLKS